jgi:hypothetical protein
MTTPSQAQRIAALEARVAAIESAMKDMEATSRDTQSMVRGLSDALLKPQPGHDKPLLDRVAAMTIKAERGEWTLRVLFWLGGVLPIGAAFAWLAGFFDGGR